MDQLRKFIVLALALISIGLLFFFAFGFFLVVLALLPIIYIVNKIRGKKYPQQSQTPHQNSEKTIDADYEVVKEETTQDNSQDKIE